MPDSDGVWPGHATAARAFVAIASQMRQVIGPAGGCVVGLDYAGAKAGLELAAIAITPDDWARVRIIEAEAVKAMNGG